MISFETYLYFMKVYLANQTGTNLYKIGITKKNPETRVKELQVGNAGTLKLIESFATKYGYKMEAAMHAHFRLKNVRDEWFELEEDDVEQFKAACEKMEKSFDVLKEANNPFF